MVMGELRMETEVVVVGAGPGGYVAALRAADLGLEVTLIDERDRPGGVCLIEGCIPSKALINAVSVVEAARHAELFGVSFSDVAVDLAKLRSFTSSTVTGLTDAVKKLLESRGIQVVRGRARFDSPTSLRFPGGAIDFRHCILATGSLPRTLPGADDLGLWGSKEALELPEVPERLAVVGGGYIGLELGSVYAGLGSKVTLIHSRPNLIKHADEDLVNVMLATTAPRFAEIVTGARVHHVERDGEGYVVVLGDGERRIEADRVLVSTGRTPNTKDLGLEAAGVKLNDGGFVVVDESMKTSSPHIWAIGDCVPGAMLAHTASREGKVAAEAVAGHVSAFDNRAIPAVVFTDPEIAWAGLTEAEARAAGRKVAVGRFPLKALGRARTLGRTDGLVKIIADADSGLVLGVGMVGPDASDLIAEGTLAIEMGATLEDVAVTIHPHPTLSEAIQEAAEAARGTSVHGPALAPGRRSGG